jgi:hypothetical protein
MKPKIDSKKLAKRHESGMSFEKLQKKWGSAKHTLWLSLWAIKG